MQFYLASLLELQIVVRLSLVENRVKVRIIQAVRTIMRSFNNFRRRCQLACNVDCQLLPVTSASYDNRVSSIFWRTCGLTKSSVLPLEYHLNSVKEHVCFFNPSATTPKSRSTWSINFDRFWWYFSLLHVVRFILFFSFVIPVNILPIKLHKTLKNMKIVCGWRVKVRWRNVKSALRIFMRLLRNFKVQKCMK